MTEDTLDEVLEMQSTKEKDDECKAYINTYKCNSESCEGCQYRIISDTDKINKITEILNKRDNAFDGQEFGATYSDLDNIIEEIRQALN